MSCKPRAALSISPTAPLLLALFVMLSSPLLLAALLLAAALHELGHCLALRALHARVTAIRISALGAEMQVAGSLSYGGEVLAAAAGPAVNLALALVLGVFNLLPIQPLDGGSILWNLSAWLTEPYTADRVAAAVSFGMAALLTLAAAAALWLGGSPFLLLAAMALFVRAVREIGLVKWVQNG